MGSLDLHENKRDSKGRKWAKQSAAGRLPLTVDGRKEESPHAPAADTEHDGRVEEFIKRDKLNRGRW